MGRNVPPEKTFSTQADIWVVLSLSSLLHWEAMKGWSSTVSHSVFRGHLLRANLIWGTMKWTATRTYLSFHFLLYIHPLKTIWRRSSSANIWLWFFTEFKNTIETITSNNHIKQKSGSRILYSLYKGWESVFQLTLWHALHGKSKKKEHDKKSSVITTPQPASYYPATLSTQKHTPDFVTPSPQSLRVHSGRCWGFICWKCATRTVLDLD